MTNASRTVIVTGAGRGIGAACAVRLARDGWSVVVNYRSDIAGAERTVAEIASKGGRALAVKANVEIITEVAALFDAACRAFDVVSAVVNNAAVNEFRPLQAVDPPLFERVFRPNVLGPLLTTAEFARRFEGSGGRVVNISSGAARGAAPGSAVYSASKAALEAVTRCAAAELGGKGITVNAVAPGATDTEMFRSQVPEQVQGRLVEATLLGRLGLPADIAAVVSFLCSEEGGWITGQVLEANGGRRT